MDFKKGEKKWLRPCCINADMDEKKIPWKIKHSGKDVFTSYFS